MDEQPIAQRRRSDKFLQEFLENSEAFAFGIVTQQGYKELKEDIETQSKRTEARLHRWLIMGLIAFTIMGLASSIGLVGFGVLLNRQSNVTGEIQKQRKSAIRANCEDQNGRNEVTIHALNVAVQDEIRKHPKREGKLRQNAEVSIGLINALAPHQDCEALVHKLTASQP